MKTNLRMADVMTREVHSIGISQPLTIAHELMRKHHVRHLPVVDHGKLVGVVTQRDLYFLESLDGLELAETNVEEAMSQDVYKVGPSDRVHDVAKVMSAKHYGCAVVMDGRKVAGIFTTVDALNALARLS